MSNEDLRTEALVTATKALTAIEEHTKSCDNRYGTIEAGNKATFHLIKGLYTRFWIVACSFISLLIATVMYLLTHNVNIAS